MSNSVVDNMVAEALELRSQIADGQWEYFTEQDTHLGTLASIFVRTEGGGKCFIVTEVRGEKNAQSIIKERTLLPLLLSERISLQSQLESVSAEERKLYKEYIDQRQELLNAHEAVIKLFDMVPTEHKEEAQKYYTAVFDQQLSGWLKKLRDLPYDRVRGLEAEVQNYKELLNEPACESENS